MQKIADILTKIREKSPVVFHITNLVTINDCANITLSVGGSPLMSFCKDELRDILSFSSSLVINIGTMEEQMREIVISAGKIANELNVPIVLDPVGIGASKARNDLVLNLIKEVKFAVIKANSAEIKTLLGLDLNTIAGVDSRENFDDENAIKDLANSLKCVIAMSGESDIISDGKEIIMLNNGTNMLSKVSGTGCMSASLIASACGAGAKYFDSAIFGLCLMGISGEMSPNIPNGSLKVAIMDNIYKLTPADFLKMAKIQNY